MPNLIKDIEKTMVKKGITKELIEEFNFSEKNGNKTKDTLVVIDQMDKLLSKDQCLSIMEEQGCCTTGKTAKAHNDFGEKYSNKSIVEKINLLKELKSVHNPPCKLNEDGTLSVFWGIDDNGKYRCVCGFMKKLDEPIKVSKTFCGCCGGHARKNLQRSLGVKLNLKKIVSSAISSKGKKQCEFLYLVNDQK